MFKFWISSWYLCLDLCPCALRLPPEIRVCTSPDAESRLPTRSSLVVFLYTAFGLYAWIMLSTFLWFNIALCLFVRPLFLWFLARICWFTFFCFFALRKSQAASLFYFFDISKRLLVWVCLGIYLISVYVISPPIDSKKDETLALGGLQPNMWLPLGSSSTCLIGRARLFSV